MKYGGKQEETGSQSGKNTGTARLAFGAALLFLVLGSAMAYGANATTVTTLNSDTTHCYLLNNFTTNNTMIFNLTGIQVPITVNSIASNSTVITVYGSQYNMSPGQLRTFLNQSDYTYVVDLGAITDTAAQQSINVDLCATQSSLPAPASSTSTTNSTTLPTTSLALNSTSTVGSNSTNQSTVSPSNAPTTDIGIVIIVAAILVLVYLVERRRKK